MIDQHRRASDIVVVLANRLADPNRLQRTIVSASDSSGTLLTLSSGYPGVALLFAEIGRTQPHQREIAHVMLERAAAPPPPTNGGSLYYGLPSLAFAARVAAVNRGDYQTLVTQLDEYVVNLTRLRTVSARQRLATPHGTAESMDAYDLINGLAGLGRYLLLAAQEHHEVLLEVLSFLVALTEPGEVAGFSVPGWWVTHAPWVDDIGSAEYALGHANLGLAHGIPGPLALLAIAWRTGFRVPGHQEAIERIVDWMLAWRRPDEYGVRWPSVITMDTHRRHLRPAASCTASWCYGVPGIGRAIQLAGLALGRADWRRIGTDAMRSLLNRPRHEWYLNSAGVCHGWAGLLQIAMRIAADTDDDDDALRVADLAAARTIALFNPDLPFGYRYPTDLERPPADGVGLLEGASGTALALHTYASGAVKGSHWDSALLLS